MFRIEIKYILLAVLALTWATVCMAQDSEIEKRSTDSEALALNDDNDETADKRLFRYGRGSFFRYGRTPVFRYGKRAPVFRYGKRSDEQLSDEDEMDLSKRLFRWGKRADDENVDYMKRIFRWGKRSDDNDELELDDKRANIFRYGKRADESVDADKRRIFHFGKRMQDFDDQDIQIRGESPHVPFRFGERRK